MLTVGLAILGAVVILSPFLKVLMDIHAAVASIAQSFATLQSKQTDQLTAAEKQSLIDTATAFANFVSTL